MFTPKIGFSALSTAGDREGLERDDSGVEVWVKRRRSRATPQERTHRPRFEKHR